jgi:hypothetical protein
MQFGCHTDKTEIYALLFILVLQRVYTTIVGYDCVVYWISLNEEDKE